MTMNQERDYEQRYAEETGGTQARFLTKIFKMQEKLDINKGNLSFKPNEEGGSEARQLSKQQRARMLAGGAGVKDELVR